MPTQYGWPGHCVCAQHDSCSWCVSLAPLCSRCVQAFICLLMCRLESRMGPAAFGVCHWLMVTGYQCCCCIDQPILSASHMQSLSAGTTVLQATKCWAIPNMLHCGVAALCCGCGHCMEGVGSLSAAACLCDCCYMEQTDSGFQVVVRLWSGCGQRWVLSSHASQCVWHGCAKPMLPSVLPVCRSAPVQHAVLWPAPVGSHGLFA